MKERVERKEKVKDKLIKERKEKVEELMRPICKNKLIRPQFT